MISALFRYSVIFLCVLSASAQEHFQKQGSYRSSLQTTEAGGDLVNNGGGLAEKIMLFTFEKMDSYLTTCLSSVSCQLDAKQTVVLKSIINGLPSEKLNPNLLQFVSEARYPGFFMINSEIKVAKTGSQPGSPIYINTDMLYTVDYSGFKVPIGMPEMLAILIHELGHHYGPESHEFLDLLGVRVGMFIAQQSYITPELPWLRDVSISVINVSKDAIGFPEMVLFLGDESVNLSEEIKKQGACLFKHYPAADLEIMRPVGTYIYNLHWATARPGGGSPELTMVANVTHWCRYATQYKVQRQEHAVMLRLGIASKGQGYELKRLSIQQQDGNIYTPKR